jgi:hypothetical protein
VLERIWYNINHLEDFTPGNEFGRMLKTYSKPMSSLGKETFFKEMLPGILESFEQKEPAGKRLHEDLRECLSTSKILCLSDSPVIQPMWGHYADSNKGAVLELRTVASLDSPYRVAQKVAYQDHPPDLYDEEFIIKLLSGEESSDPIGVRDKMLFTKHTNWSAEREWRLVSGDGRFPEEAAEDISFHRAELESVIVGARAESEFLDRVLHIVSKDYPWTRVERIEASSGFQLKRVLTRPADRCL